MLRSYYRRVVLLSAGVVFGLNLIYGITDIIFSSYKSEWLTSESFFPFTMFIALINSLIIGILCLTIFLNHYPAIKNNFILSPAACLFCPMLWIAVLLIKNFREIFNYADGWDSPGIFVIINTVPYLIILILSYIKYSQHLKQVIS